MRRSSWMHLLGGTSQVGGLLCNHLKLHPRKDAAIQDKGASEKELMAASAREGITVRGSAVSLRPL